MVDLEQNQILSNGDMEEDERERKMRIVSHVEFEMTERIELIKKKIAQKWTMLFMLCSNLNLTY